MSISSSVPMTAQRYFGVKTMVKLLNCHHNCFHCEQGEHEKCTNITGCFHIVQVEEGEITNGR